MKKTHIPYILTLTLLGSFYGFSSSDLKEIEMALLDKKYPQAEKLSRAILDSHPSRDVARQVSYYLGLTQLDQGKYRDAQKIFDDLAKDSLDQPLKDKAALGLFDAYFLDEKYRDALNVIDRLAKANPSSDYLSLIYLKSAKVNLKLAQWNEASKYLKNIITNFPQSLEANIARQLLEEKQYFAVQVGSFAQRERAEQLVNELKKKGQYAYIVETGDQQNGKYCRVRVGQFSGLDDAQKMKLELSSLGYPTQIFP